MKYGLHLAGGASMCDRTALREVAIAAEEEGYDCILIGDHIVLPKTITTPWPYDPTRMTQDTIQRYRDFGVKTLFTVPLSRDPDGIVREVREFATRVQDVS